MAEPFIVVDGYAGTLDLRDQAWHLALDQRGFATRRVLVAFGDRDGRGRVRLPVDPQLPAGARPRRRLVEVQ